jgi:cytochrome c5
MKAFLISMAALVVLGLYLSTPEVYAEDGAVLFEKLTCHTCHGPQGKGMVRTEDKERYYLRQPDGKRGHAHGYCQKINPTLQEKIR